MKYMSIRVKEQLQDQRAASILRGLEHALDVMRADLLDRLTVDLNQLRHSVSKTQP